MAGPRTTLRRKLTRLMLFASVLGLLLAMVMLALLNGYQNLESARRNAETLAKVLADNSTAALSFGDERAVQRLLAAVQAQRDVRLACVFAGNEAAQERRAMAYAAWPTEAISRCPDTLLPDDGKLWNQRLRTQQAVSFDGEVLGTLGLELDLGPLHADLQRQLLVAGAVLAMAFVLAFGIAHRAQTAMVQPLVELAELARRVTTSADYQLRSSTKANDEVGQLAQDFNGMLAKIASSDGELRAARDALGVQVAEKTKANQELEQILERLKAAQAQLVQSEKMASLGALVAGVAHEINTPVGVSVTAASTLQAKAVALKQLHESATMRRSDLESFVAVAEESTRILLNNLHRAAELIQSFKRVAVDQSSDERRTFALAPYLGEVFLSLGPKLRQVRVTLQCPESVVVDSYPGAIAQIITNFVTNSVAHGFDDGREGSISVRVTEQSEGMLALHYQDNGKGVAPEHLPRIFDPFFTTKRGAGGSGLGMNIVFNLVTQRLGGRIEASSAPQQGLSLRLSFPAASPAPAPATHPFGPQAT